jgi:Domain of unknown function (DUF1330)
VESQTACDAADHGAVGGAKYLARGTKTASFKGEPPKRIVLLVFDDFDKAQATFTSPAFMVNRASGRCNRRSYRHPLLEVLSAMPCGNEIASASPSAVMKKVPGSSCQQTALRITENTALLRDEHAGAAAVMSSHRTLLAALSAPRYGLKKEAEPPNLVTGFFVYGHYVGHHPANRRGVAPYPRPVDRHAGACLARHAPVNAVRTVYLRVRTMNLIGACALNYLPYCEPSACYRLQPIGLPRIEPFENTPWKQ